MSEKPKGKIQVTIQTEDRLAVIAQLARTVDKLADALLIAPHVEIRDCQAVGNDVGFEIDTSPEVTRTEVFRVGE